MVDIPKNILFVDMDQNFLDAIRRMIVYEKYPWRVYTFNSAKAALESEEIGTMDVILTDLIMEGYDGFWLIQQILERPHLKNIPIIVLTSLGEEHLKRKALKMGATDLLNKPIHPDDLFIRISTVARMKEYQDELKRRNKVLEKEVIRRTYQLEISQVEIIWKLARAGEFRDDQSGKHVVRVGYFSQILARGLNLSEDEVKLIFITSPLHDIGKIRISDATLRKPLPLTNEELNEIKNHCVYGNQILLERSGREIMFIDQFLENKREFVQTGMLSNPFLAKAAEIALTHHESWDGSGYPQGLKKKNIPLSGRIVAITDSYDAMRSIRPYKPAYTHEESITMISAEAGYRFDPEIIEIFLSKADQFLAAWNQLSG